MPKRLKQLLILYSHSSILERLVLLTQMCIRDRDAFDDVDSVTPMERQEEILNMVIDICHTEFKFDTSLGNQFL